MSKHQFLGDIRQKDEVVGEYLVKFISLFDTKDGKKYINIILSDSSGDIEGRIWNNGEEIFARVNKNDFVHLKAKANIYQGRRQLIINEIESVNPESLDMSLYIRTSKQEPKEMYSELNTLVDSLNDFYIKSLLKLILDDKEIERRLLKWQAGKTIHHAYQGGLLEHILSCSRLAFDLSDHYGVNKNYVVAGAILHDLCKIYELTDGINVEYTEEGKLIGHLVKGIEIIDRFTYKIKSFPYQMKMHLKHIVLSHHGSLEYGSPKVPLTREAFLVHYIDLLDSKMGSFEAILKQDSQAGHWSNYIKHLDRMLYKGELPFFDGPVENSNQGSHQKKNRNPDLKQNLGDLLKKIKVDDK